mgnify:CR=1 FL=1
MICLRFNMKRAERLFFCLYSKQKESKLQKSVTKIKFHDLIYGFLGIKKPTAPVLTVSCAKGGAQVRESSGWPSGASSYVAQRMLAGDS